MNFLTTKATLFAVGLFLSGICGVQAEGRLRGALIQETGRARVPELKLQDVAVPLTSGEIIGGDTSPTNAYPWMVALVDGGSTDLYQAQFCGGVLVHPGWVLTAAHCVYDLRAEDVDAVVGIKDLSDPTGSERRGVVEILVHEAFSPFTLNFDIALLRLSEPVTNFAPLVMIDDGALNEAGKFVRVLGWGATSVEEDLYPEELQEVDLPMATFQLANQIVYGGTLTTNMMAAGYSEGGVDTCVGDSGGPLISRLTVGSPWRLVGLTSFGDGTCGSTYGIYSDVEALRPWVLERILPDFAAWEAFYGIVGEYQTNQVYGLNQLSVFAVGVNPTNLVAGEFPSLQIDASSEMGNMQFLRPLDSGDLRYFVDSSSQPDFPSFERHPVVGGTVTQGATLEVMEVPLDLSAAGSQRFFRIHSEIEPVVSNRVRNLRVPGFALHRLLTNDVPASRTYRLLGLPLASNHWVTARSDAFDITLELLDDQGDLLQSSSNGSAGSLDEKLLIPGGSSDAAFARIRPAGGVAEGEFQLSVHSTEHLPVLNEGDVHSGTLTFTDPVDEWQGLPAYFVNDVVVHPPYTNSATLQAEMIGGSLTSLVIVLDAELGIPVPENQEELSSLLQWAPNPDKSYVLRVTSYYAGDFGDYVLRYGTVPPNLVLSNSTNVMGLLQAYQPTVSNRVGSNALVEAYYVDYRVTNIPTNRAMRVLMESLEIDSYFSILSADEQTLLYRRDDLGGGSLDSLIEFDPPPGEDLVIRASSAGGFETGVYSLDLSFPAPLRTLSVNSATTTNVLSATSDIDSLWTDGNYYKHDFVVVGANDGESVTVEMSSDDVDCYLELIGASGETSVQEVDGTGAGGAESLTFTIDNGVEYWIRATTYDAEEVGTYMIRAFPSSP